MKKLSSTLYVMKPKALKPYCEHIYVHMLNQHMIFLWFWVYYIYDQVIVNGQTK